MPSVKIKSFEYHEITHTVPDIYIVRGNVSPVQVNDTAKSYYGVMNLIDL
jgi:hypothetical protein